MIRVDVSGLSEAEKAIRTFAAGIVDLRGFWRELGRSLADDAQARWPLRRRTGKLRQSLVWRGDKLGRGGVFESSPNQLTFGTNVFYARFAQIGTKRQRATPLIHIDEAQHSEQLKTWLRARALSAGLAVE